MRLSSKDVFDVFALGAYVLGSRAFGLATIFFLARYLSVEHFSWWQLGKTAAGYVTMLMEAGFYFHVTLLVRDGYSLGSVRAQIYRHRFTLLLIAAPVFFLYLHYTIVPLWFSALFIPLLIISVADYDALAIAAGISVITGKARLIKGLLTLLVVVLVGAFYRGPLLSILSAITGAAGAAILLHYAASRHTTISTGKRYVRSLWASLVESRHFLVLQVTMTSMQTADMIIAGLFLSASDVAHYGIALLGAEVALFPTYMILRVIHAKYFRHPKGLLIVKFGTMATAASLALLLGHYLLVHPVYAWIFPKYDSNTLHWLTSVLLLYVAVRTANAFLQLHMNATGQERQVARGGTIGALMNITGNLIVAPTIGLLAVPWVTVVSETAILIILFCWVKRESPCIDDSSQAA